MMSILLIVILSVVVLLKWVICMILYPIIVLSALEKKVSNERMKKFLCFPLKVVEHFLRYGGGQGLLLLIYRIFHHAISENYFIKGWV